MSGSGIRERASAFFALDDEWVRVPAPGATRVDATLAVVLLLLSAFGLELARSAGALGVNHAPWAQYVALAATAAPIAFRRRQPVIVVAVSSLVFFVVGVVMPDVTTQLSVQVLYFFTLYSAMAWARDRRQVLVVVGAVLVLMFGWLIWQFALGSAIDEIISSLKDHPETKGLFSPIAATVTYLTLVNILYFGGAVLGGQAAWRAARQRARLAEQAETLSTQATELREHAVVQERLRIARELHDVVAHHVSVMGVQAGAARRVLAVDPAAASTALTSVEGSARQAVTEMRALLGTLRHGEDEGHTGADRSPEPGLAGIPELVDQFEAPEFSVSYAAVEDAPGAVERVSPAAALTLYRTVQEALNNVRRHSTASRAGVVLRVETRGARGGFAEVEVLDDGRPRTGTSGTGLGLLGMRERVASLDGILEIGPRVTGGFRVRVRLPLTGGTRG